MPEFPGRCQAQTVHVFITTRVDYCNALLYGATATVIHTLQLVLHAAAQLITGVHRKHITVTSRDELHWLPVPQCIVYKIALTALDCVRG